MVYVLYISGVIGCFWDKVLVGGVEGGVVLYFCSCFVGVVGVCCLAGGLGVLERVGDGVVKV